MMQSWELIAHVTNGTRLQILGHAGPLQMASIASAIIALANLRPGPCVVDLSGLTWRMRWSEFIIDVLPRYAAAMGRRRLIWCGTGLTPEHELELLRAAEAFGLNWDAIADPAAAVVLAAVDAPSC